jgi:sugar phosphate isomerase/epimerase
MLSTEAKRPTLAACEWIFGDRPLGNTVAALVAAGYDALLVTGEPDRRDVDEIERLFGEADLTIAGATSNTAGHPARDLAQPDRTLRMQAVEYYRGCIDLLERLGASTLGIVPSPEGRLGALSSYAQEWELAVEATRELALYAGERGVLLAIEPLNRYEAFLVNRVEQACAFAADVGVDGVGVIADFFHMNIEEPDMSAAIELAGDRLLEIHLADSNREGLGSGHLPSFDLLKRAKASGFQRTLAVECFAPPPAFSFASASAAAARIDGFLEQCARVVGAIFSDSS